MVRVAIAVICLMLLPSAAWAQAGKRIALIITNQSYTQAGARLTNTHRDGELLKSALERVGFRVWVAKDTRDERALLQAIAGHVQRLSEAGPEAVGFFYYSGHGAADRPNGENYLIPTDVPLTHASQLPLLAVRLEKITSSLASVGSTGFVVFDACRNVPLQRDTKDVAFKGFVPVREQNGLLVAFATEPGNVAVDQSKCSGACGNACVPTPGRRSRPSIWTSGIMIFTSLLQPLTRPMRRGRWTLVSWNAHRRSSEPPETNPASKNSSDSLPTHPMPRWHGLACEN
jgi:hypothetical protein